MTLEKLTLTKNTKKTGAKNKQRKTIHKEEEKNQKSFKKEK